MNFKNILIAAIIVLTIVAGLTLSIKNYAKTAITQVCTPFTSVFFCPKNSILATNSKVNSKDKFVTPLPFTLPPSLTPVIEAEKKEEPKVIETLKKEDLKTPKVEIAKTNVVETKSNAEIFKPTPKTNQVSNLVSNTYYPTSPSYWNVFEGFDFSGKMKQIYNSENHEFVDNSIILRAKKELTSNPLYSTKIDDQRYYTKAADYAGSKLMLKDKFQYGHIQFQAKIPNISGILPAVWLLNQDGNNFTEVDLLEVPGSEKNTVYGVTHYGPNYASLTSDHSKMYVPNLSTQFHTYDMYKTPEKITVFIDGSLLYEKNVSNAKKYNGINGLDQPLQLIINLNIGDAWAGPINDAQLPVSMTIKDMLIEEYQY